MIKIALSFFCLLSFSLAYPQKTKKENRIIIHFENRANGKKIVLNDSIYSTIFDEKYAVHKLKYYVSDIHFITQKKEKVIKEVFLIDAAKDNTINLLMPEENIAGIQFLLGVDSLLNCSGAQEGALDPLNDMYWTWNSGYVMFKMEGTSNSSPADKQRIEQHIGGYKGAFKTMRMVKLFCIKNKEITIVMNLDKYWDGINKIKIAEMPVIAAIGEEAKKIADNFAGMFCVAD